MSKTPIRMKQETADWSYLLEGGQSRDIFDTLSNNHSQFGTVSVADDTTVQFTLDDFDITTLKELNLVLTIEVNNQVEKRYIILLKDGSGWDRTRRMVGVRQKQIDIHINQASSTAYPVIDVIGTGNGDACDIKYFANSKL